MKLVKIFVFSVGEKISRENFSVEHKIPWLDSENPVKLYFDLDNIAFSHLSCNIGAGRRNIAKCGTLSAYKRGCRCESCTAEATFSSKQKYTPQKRRDRYLRNGK